MTKEKIGVDQIIKVVDVIIEAGNVSEKVASAKNIVSKVSAMLPMTDEVLALASLSLSLLKVQYKDLDDLEREEISKHIKEKFDLADDELEAKVELAVDLVGEGVDYLDRAITFAKSLKKKVA